MSKSGADLRGAEGAAAPLLSGNHSEKGKMLLFANCKIKHFTFSECRKCHFRDSIEVQNFRVSPSENFELPKKEENGKRPSVYFLIKH